MFTRHYMNISNSTLKAQKAKPFLKWAGGKTQLISAIDSYLPPEFCGADPITYIEPFVGGGALLFHLLQTYPNIQRAVINDINPRLITAYRTIRDNVGSLIICLKEMDREYKSLGDYDRQKEYYLKIRESFNKTLLSEVEVAASLIFLNRTCFNGLYRENSKGNFNVPFGRYNNPLICNEELLNHDSEVLKKVEILNGDFYNTKEYVSGFTFFYFDPPYRPLDCTSSFNTYVKEAFNDNEQIRLRDFFTELTDINCKALLSNSDGKGRNEADTFLEDIYKDFVIERVYAKRAINANPSKRGVLTELLIRNYAEIQVGGNLFCN